MFRPEELARRLREIRMEMGLSQVDMAKKLGVSRGALCYYENGQRTPDIAFLCALHELSGCSMEYLTGGSEAKKTENADASKTMGLNDEALEFIRVFSEGLNKIIKTAPDELNSIMAIAHMYAIGGTFPALPEITDTGWRYTISVIPYFEDCWKEACAGLLEACKREGYASLSEVERDRMRERIREEHQKGKGLLIDIPRDDESVSDRASDRAKIFAFNELRRLDDIYRRSQKENE